MARKPAIQSKATKKPTSRKTSAKPAKPNVPEFTKDDELRAYREMLLIRRFEEKAGQMYGMGLIGGFCHLYIGQEAVVTGINMAARPDDASITSYRDHGHMLAVGIDPKGVMAELTGRADGLSKGKGGSMHMFSTEKRFYGGTALLARKCPLVQVWHLPPNIGAKIVFPLPISATGPPTRAKSMRVLTWQNYGICRWSTSSKTTNTPWGHP